MRPVPNYIQNLLGDPLHFKGDGAVLSSLFTPVICHLVFLFKNEKKKKKTSLAKSSLSPLLSTRRQAGNVTLHISSNLSSL